MQKTPKRNRIRPLNTLWVVLASCALAGFTTFVLLDTFVIGRVQQTVQEADLSSIVAAQGQSQETGIAAGSKSDDESSSATENAQQSTDEAATSSASSESSASSSASAKSSESSASSGSSSKSGRSSGSKGKPGKPPTGSKGKPSGTHGKHSSSSESSGDSSSRSGNASHSSDKSSSSSSTDASTVVAGAASASSAGTSIGSYSDDNIKIEVSSVRAYDTDIYVADIQVSSAEYLKTALAQNAFGRNLKDTTSNIAQDNGAILAINGDYYGFRDDGYVVRNGILYRDTATAGSDALVVYGDGTMGAASQDSTTAQQLVDDGAWQVLSFGPVLVNDGSIAIDTDEEVSQSMRSNPRTAIGMISPLHYVVVVSDGRTGDNAGLSLYELAQVLVDNGATFAYNLDGGGSTTMYFKGEVINNPTSGNVGGERSVSDIVYFG